MPCRWGAAIGSAHHHPNDALAARPITMTISTTFHAMVDYARRRPRATNASLARPSFTLPARSTTCGAWIRSDAVALHSYQGSHEEGQVGRALRKPAGEIRIPGLSVWNVDAHVVAFGDELDLTIPSHAVKHLELPRF